MNEHIIDYCKDRYIKSTMNPKFAVLIKGEWGCGKTHLVKKILEDSFGEDWEKQVIWLSVYGLSTIQQVNQKLYEKIHPILTHKLAKFAGNVAKSAVKISTGLDLNKDNTNDIVLDISWSDIEQEQDGKKTKKLLVIDDIERCSIPPCELLGFFADSILDKDMKAIFIGNIEEMPSDKEAEKEQTDTDLAAGANKQEFDKIKEKIIGIEFKVEPDTKEAIEFFIKEIDSDSINGIENILTNKCIEVMDNLGCKNLRNIRQAFFHINQLLKILGSDRKDVEYISKLVEYYLVVFIQKSNGELKKEDTTGAIDVYCKSKKTLKKYNVDVKDLTFDNRPYYHLNIPLGILFSDIIFDGKFRVEDIKKDYDIFVNIKNNPTSLQKLNRSWFSMDDTTFHNLFPLVEKDFEQNKFLNCSEIFTYANLLLALSNGGIISETYDKIKDRLFSYIKTNASNIKPERDFLTPTVTSQFYDWKSTFTEILEELKLNNNKVTIEQMKKDFTKWYTNLPDNFDILIKNIYRVNGNPTYRDYPILTHIDVKSLYENIALLSYDKQSGIYSAFNERYGQPYSNEILDEPYFSDIPKVKELANLYKPSNENVLMSPENNRKKLFSMKYEKLYEWMIAEKTKKEQTGEQEESL